MAPDQPRSSYRIVLILYIHRLIMPSRALLYLTYVALSATAFYYMRLGPAGLTVGKHIEPLTQGVSSFRYPGRDTIIRQHYTGWKPLDGFLSILVTAFLAGPAGWRRDIQVQQINFLTSFLSLLVIMSFESVRRCNKWRMITLCV
jgi:hypothetical protein